MNQPRQPGLPPGSGQTARRRPGPSQDDEMPGGGLTPGGSHGVQRRGLQGPPGGPLGPSKVPPPAMPPSLGGPPLPGQGPQGPPSMGLGQPPMGGPPSGPMMGQGQPQGPEDQQLMQMLMQLLSSQGQGQ